MDVTNLLGLLMVVVVVIAAAWVWVAQDPDLPGPPEDW